jgi:serine beta-lactamase-like protein LACTB, mitochondrial
MRPLRPLLIAVTATACAPAVAAPSPADLSQRMLDDLVAVSGVPGMGAAVWRGDRIVWQGSSGLRDVERGSPVTADTIFRLASVSKLLAATAAARLGEQGRFDLDAPVTTILPWLRNGWAPMNARQLAAHISGMPHYNGWDQANLGPTHYPNSRAAVAIFEARPLLTPPGACYTYSSWGYTLLGALIEQTSGMSFPDYVSREVTPGLAVMRDATDGPNPDATIAYEFIDRRPQRARPVDMSYTWGGGGMAATPSALATFGGWMTQDRIVSAATFDTMLRPARLNDGSEAGERDFQVGFGWRTSPDEDGRPTAHHAGVFTGARSALVLWREERVAVSLLSNATWLSAIEKSAQLLAAPFRAAPEGLVATDCPVGARRYEGSFNGEPVSGAARFTQEAGLCTGRIEAMGSLRAFLDGGMQSRAGELRVVGIDASGGLARAGLVTPFGIYDLRATADGGFRAAFGGTRNLSIRLD